MADAKQCDRCEGCCPSFKSYRIETNAISGTYMKMYDLCPACAGEIQKWWFKEADEEESLREPGDHDGV